MAKKSTPSSAKNIPAAKTKASEVVTTPVRNTVVPPRSVAVAAAAPAKKIPPTYDAIAHRAYMIWKETGGSEYENWIRAERELSI